MAGKSYGQLTTWASGVDPYGLSRERPFLFRGKKVVVLILRFFFVEINTGSFGSSSPFSG